MATVTVVGQKPGSIELSLPEPKTHVLYEVVNWQLAKRRAGTASTKTRATVSRTGKKIYSQKGTGNARHGDRAAPIYVGGGVAFGPKPRDYSYTLPKKVRKLGLRMALSSRASEGKLTAVNGFGLEGKTKAFVTWAKQNGLDGTERVFLVTDDEMALRAARNLPWVTAVKVAGLNVYDVLRHDRLLIDAAALETFQGEEAPKKTVRDAKPVKKPVQDGAAKPVKARAATPKVEAPKAEPARVEAPKAETPKAAKSTKGGDDLKRIEGIGPKINDALIAAGIDTFARLEKASEDDLKAALEAAKLRFAPSLPTWAEQAGYLVRGDEAGFKAFTEKLVAGRAEPAHGTGAKEEGEA
jgi:large subunit ribosomal protein L4